MRAIEDILRSYDPAAPLERASTLSAPFYTDPRIAALEAATVWSHNWQFACRAEEVALPGHYVTVTLAGEPLVIVRGNDGVLRAFFNVCRHHAARVMTEPCGRADQLRCPYHSWTYGLDGGWKSAPEWSGVADFDPRANGLVPVEVDAWDKLVFVRIARPPQRNGLLRAPGAPDASEPLSAFLGELPAHMAPLGLGDLRFCERRSWEIGCNWKVFVDNYLDGGYHVPFLHKGLNSILDFKAYTIENFGRVCLQKSPINAEGGEEMTASVRHGQALYYWLYPNFMLNWYQGYLDTNWVLPLAVDRTLVVFDFYFADVSPAAAERNRRSMDVSERIQDEDHGICVSVQQGLSSRAYGQGRLSVRREAGEHLFHRLLHADLISV